MIATAEPSEAHYAAQRKLTIRWVLIGYTTFAITFTTAWFAVPRMAPIAAPIDRLLLALQLAAGPGIVLLLVLQGLWRLNDTPAAEDPFANKESYLFRVNQRVMSNTLEQAAIFVPIFIALAIRMEPAQVTRLPLLMGFWCTARLMFWIGYRKGLHYRAPGMDWTTSTCLVTTVLLVMTLF